MPGLDGIQNPSAFARTQHDLALSNLNRLYPTWWQNAFFENHPSPPWRIGQANAWARLHKHEASTSPRCWGAYRPWSRAAAYARARCSAAALPSQVRAREPSYNASTSAAKSLSTTCRLMLIFGVR